MLILSHIKIPIVTPKTNYHNYILVWKIPKTIFVISVKNMKRMHGGMWI